MLVPIAILLIFCGAFLVTVLAVLIASKAIERQECAAARWEPGSAESLEPSPLLKAEALSSLSAWAYLLARFSFVETLKARMAEADLPWSVGRLTALMLLSGTIVAVAFAQVERIPEWARLAGAAAAAAVPYGYVLRRRRRRLDRFEQQLPDGLDFLARALRAGHPFASCLEMLANENAQPLAGEIRKVADERRLGMSWEHAFENFCRRVPIQEVGIFAAAVQMQSRTGGKLSEVLNRIAENLRENAALRGEVRAISAHGRLTAAVLTLLPVAIVAVLASASPGYLAILVVHPFGKHLIAASVGCLIAAHFVIRRIVDVRL